MLFQIFKTFISVYETHNFTRTADQLFLSQPTVSAQIKKLEENLGVSLFIRNGKQEIIPTKEADFLYPRMLKIIEEWEDAASHVTQSRNFREQCTIACSEICSAYLMSHLAPLLTQTFPLIDFTFLTMDCKKVVEELEHAKIDFGMIESPEKSSQIKRKKLFESNMVIAGNPDAPYWIIDKQTTSMRELNEYYLNLENIQPSIIYVDRREVLQSFLLSGQGKTILTQLAVDESIPFSSLIEPPPQAFYFLTREEVISEVLSDVAQTIQDYFLTEQTQETQN